MSSNKLNKIMKNVNRIGLDTDQSKKTVEKLNELLANYSIFYQNVRGYHWNVTGENFFDLHIKFEELYTDLVIKIDDVAERIRELGGFPNHNYSHYLTVSEIKESEQLKDGVKCVEGILQGFTILISKQRKLAENADKNSDDGTNDLMTSNIREQEKLAWMYAAFLNK